ncbi:MAG: hypothetical protein JXA44_12985 [Methanospirillaceae archaeon]|nr:hypothetical protein [Methanospirillaceae archaeon]
MHHRLWYILVVLLLTCSVSFVFGDDIRLTPSQVREWNVFADRVNDVCDRCEGDCDCINTYFHPIALEKFDLNALPTFRDYETAAEKAQELIDNYYAEVALIQENCENVYYRNYRVPAVPVFSIPHSAYLTSPDHKSITTKEIPNSTKSSDSKTIITGKYPSSDLDNEKTILTRELPSADPYSRAGVLSESQEEWVQKDLRSYVKESYARYINENRELTDEIEVLYRKVYNVTWDPATVMSDNSEALSSADGTGSDEEKAELATLLREYEDSVRSALSEDAVYWAETHYGSDSAEYVLISSAFVLPTPELIEYAASTSVSPIEGAILAGTKVGDIMEKYGFP